MKQFNVTKQCTWNGVLYKEGTVAEFFEGAEPFVYKKLKDGKVDNRTQLPHPYFEEIEEEK